MYNNQESENQNILTTMKNTFSIFHIDSTGNKVLTGVVPVSIGEKKKTNNSNEDVVKCIPSTPIVPQHTQITQESVIIDQLPSIPHLLPYEKPYGKPYGKPYDRLNHSRSGNYRHNNHRHYGKPLVNDNFTYLILNHVNLQSIRIKGICGRLEGQLVEVTPNKTMTKEDINNAQLQPLYIADMKNGKKGGSPFKVYFEVTLASGKTQIIYISRRNDTGTWRRWFDNKDAKTDKEICVHIHPCDKDGEFKVCTIEFCKWDHHRSVESISTSATSGYANISTGLELTIG